MTDYTQQVFEGTSHSRGEAGGRKYYGVLYGHDDHLEGTDGVTDYLQGGKGNDVYWLGRGAGNDGIYEGHYQFGSDGDSNDVIRLKEGLTSDDVRLERDTDHLYVRLVDSDGAVTDSFMVRKYYYSEAAKIERVELSDGTLVYGAEDFGQVRLRDGPGEEGLVGRVNFDDHFDADAGGNDRMFGRDGDDVYWLGRGTGDDYIYEGQFRLDPEGDSGDVIRLKEGLTSDDVRLERMRDDLFVRLVDSRGAVTDSYWVVDHYSNDAAKIERVELSDGTLVYALVPIRMQGVSGNDILRGRDGMSDHFDADAGGDDILFGGSGDDVYWLGRGTGNDVIDEGRRRDGDGDAGDTIRLEKKLTGDDVLLERDTDHLYVRLLDGDGAVTDSYTVRKYYASEDAKIERVELSDGTLLYGADDFAAARMHGGSGNDKLYGHRATADHFDADAGGDDILYGRSGDDVYWLGRGTDNDIIREYRNNDRAGDAGDVIEVRDYGIENVRIERNGNDLLVKLIEADGTSDNSYTVAKHFGRVAAEVESINLGDLVFSTSNAESYISAWDAFHDEEETSEYETFQELADAYWV